MAVLDTKSQFRLRAGKTLRRWGLSPLGDFPGAPSGPLVFCQFSEGRGFESGCERRCFFFGMRSLVVAHFGSSPEVVLFIYLVAGSPFSLCCRVTLLLESYPLTRF
jgi:hypothetical protein